MKDLAQFLHDRTNEDERDAHNIHDRQSDGYLDSAYCICGYPTRVLSEVKAKQRLLEEHTPAVTKGRPNRERGCLTCTTAQTWDVVANEANCLTLRLLALPYADHPGYREEWRP